MFDFIPSKWNKKQRLYPSAPFEKNIDVEQRLEKKLNDVISFNNSIKNIKEMIRYFKDKNHKSKKRYEKYKTLNTILESVDTIVFIGATSTSITLSITAIGLTVLPISAGIACTLSLGYKVLHKLIMSKYNEYKKRYERDQQTIKSFDKLYRKSLQDNVVDKTEYEGLCNIFTKYLEETKKWIFFISMNIKIKLVFFSHDKLKFNLEILEPRFPRSPGT